MKSKLTIAKAVEMYKKGVDRRNTANTETEIATFISEQVELKKGEIKTLEKEITKYGEQNARDFIENLAVFDESQIKSVKGREAYAEDYVLNGILKMKANSDFIEDKQDEINDLKEQIDLFNEFEEVLKTISTKIGDFVEEEA